MALGSIPIQATMKHLTIIIPSRIPDRINIRAEDNVSLQTILNRYDEWGNVILRNGLIEPLTTIVEDNDMIIILNRANGDAHKSPQ